MKNSIDIGLKALAAALVVVSAVAAWAQSAPGKPEPSRPEAPSGPGRYPISKGEMFAPQYRATGNLSVVEVKIEGKQRKEEVRKTFGSGTAAEAAAKAFMAEARTKTSAGSAPFILRREFTHERCRKPRRYVPGFSESDGAGSDSDTDCNDIKVGYTLPPDQDKPLPFPDCKITVDVDVIFLGRRARSVTWALKDIPDFISHEGKPLPRIRFLDLDFDPEGQEVRGITIFDNNGHPRERTGPDEDDPTPLLSPATMPAHQLSTNWTRDFTSNAHRREIRKSYYYAIVLQVWSDKQKSYIFCEPYDPTIINRGN